MKTERRDKEKKGEIEKKNWENIIWKMCISGKLGSKARKRGRLPFCTWALIGWPSIGQSLERIERKRQNRREK